MSEPWMGSGGIGPGRAGLAGWMWEMAVAGGRDEANMQV